MNSATRSLLATVLASGLARQAPAQTKPVRDLANATIEDLMTIVVTTASRAPDRRCLTINPRAYTNLEELIGAPQNPPRLTVGFSLRVR
jgi:hypothetical protein